MANLAGFVAEGENLKHTPPNQPSILEQFPAFDFVLSAPLVKEKSREILIGIAAILIFAIFLSYMSLIDYYKGRRDALIQIFIFAGPAIIGAIWLIKKIVNMRSIRSTAYYIQRIEKCKANGWKYAFIVSSDRKWGLVKLSNMKILIPPTYDFMQWKTANEYLIVHSGGRTEIRDINNRLCL